MKKTVKRVFSLFLCVTLCLTMFPAAAFAEVGTAEGATVPAEQPESSVVLSVEEPAVSAETEAAAEKAEETLFQFSSEQRSAILSRDDGLWLFPLDKAYYGNITDWNGCRGAESCLFCGESHESCPDSEHSGLKYGHWGLDISAPEGTAVYAPADGAVWWTDRDWEGLGYTLVLERPAENGRSYYAVFSHLSDICLESGSRVAAGELIALTGSSGAVDEQEHLVFSLFLAQSDLGQRVAADPVAELAAVAEKGWLEDGSSVGMVNNNPAAGSPARPLPEDSTILPLLEKHPGTVRYTFDAAELYPLQSAELPAEETVSQEEPAQANAAAEEPDADTTSTIVASGTCGDNLTWTLDDTGLLTISGTGKMSDYSSDTPAPWYQSKENITSVNIISGVTSIGNYGFFETDNIKNVSMPNSLTSIGQYAFFGCDTISSLTIPGGITNIGEYAFSSCSSLNSVIFSNASNNPESNKTYLENFEIVASARYTGNQGDSFINVLGTRNGTTDIHGNHMQHGLEAWIARWNFKAEKSWAWAEYELAGQYSTLSGKVTIISDCYNRTSFNSTIEILGDGVLLYSSVLVPNMDVIQLNIDITGVNILRIYIYDNTSSKGGTSFGLWDIAVSDSETNIGFGAFYNCNSLTQVTILENITDIDESAFAGCINLSDIYYSGSKAQWNAISIGSDNDPLLNATIHYFSNIGSTGAISLDKLSVICYANQKGSEKTSEDFVLCPEVSVTSGLLQETTDEKGQASINKPDSDVTFSKTGYVSRTISPERLSHNNAVYLQKESDYPVISALWLGDTDILHEELLLEYASEENFDLSPEVDWGQSSMQTLQLYQEGNTMTLQDGSNSVQLAKTLDITEDIYLVATNADGLSTKKLLKIKSSTTEALNGFSFNLGDSLSFTLPDSAGLFAGQEFKLDLYSRIPIEIVYEDGKVYAAIGFQLDAEEDSESQEHKLKVKSFTESVKDMRESISAADDEISKYNYIRKKMKELDGLAAITEGSIGVDGNFSVMAFAEGYIDSSGNFVLTDSGGILAFGASVSYTQPFMAGPVPMFFELKLSGDVEAQMNLYINQKIKEFTPKMEIEGVIALQGGVGVGLAKVASLSGGLVGKLIQNLNLDNGIDYYKLTASLEWYVKLKVLFASWEEGDEIASAVWYEYPEPGTASAQALQESSGGKPDFYDSSRYTMDDLSYLERGSGFIGGGASVLSVDGSSGDGPFVSNAYEGASPQAVSFSDGTRLAVWIGYNDLHSGPDALNLYYSYYDGAWSQPQVVEDDGTTDAAPCLRVFDDTAYLVWQDASGSIPESATLDSTANLMEISGGVFDRDSVSFTCAGITGGSGVLNMTPTLCGDGSTVCAVWLRNGANDWFGQNYDNSILTSSFSEGSWSSPATLFAGLGPVVSMAADCTGGSVSVAYSIDGDCDLNTSEDMEVYLNGKALTENEYIDNGVCFSGGNLYWYSGGRLLENGNDTMAEDAAIGSDRFQIINENGIKALVYAAEDGLASVLYAAYYDSASGGWGSPIVLYSAGTSISAFSASATADGEISVLLQSQAVTGNFGSEDPYGEVSLVWYNAPMGCNIRLDDVRIDNSAYVAGKDVPLYLSLSNTGELAVKSLLIEILDADGTVLQKETIAQQLLSGETVELMTEYSVKEVVQGKALTVRVSAVGAEETLNDDNSADIVLGWNDLTVENVRYGVTESGETVIHASIVNRGYELQSGVTVELREGSPSGTLVESKTVNELSAFSLENVSFSLSGPPAALYYVCVERKESDCNYGNDNSFVEIRAQSGEETATPGDLNGDGQVNTMDLIRLMKYISGVEVDVAPGSADVNGDGKENTMDLIRLMKLVNGEIV